MFPRSTEDTLMLGSRHGKNRGSCRTKLMEKIVIFSAIEDKKNGLWKKFLYKLVVARVQCF